MLLCSPICSFFVEGLAETKGSWISLGAGRMKADNPRERPWAARTAWTARIEMRGKEPTRKRVSVSIEVTLPAPPNATKKNRRDIDKLARSILDALTGIVYVDDEQVDDLTIRKVVAERGHGARVVIAPIVEALRPDVLVEG